MTDIDSTELRRLLQARADSVEVRPNLSAVLDPSNAPSGPGGGRERWLVVAAAASVVVIAVAVSARQPGGGDLQTTSPDRSSGLVTEFAAPATDYQIVVWLQPNASTGRVQTVSRRLADSADVEAFEYFDQDATYLEFTAYFADDPDVIDLVQPEQLPTSFRVTSFAGSSAIADLLQDLSVVQAVDGLDP